MKNIIKKLESIREELEKVLNYENTDAIDEGTSLVDDLIFHINVRI
tara:strand:+ start:378 stop:515 length:138 start_codon:yes stop_codon:yes gene_type:complete